MEKMAKRSKTDIIIDMLSCINEKGGKIKPTHLMYKSNLSHIQMKNYLLELVKKELVEEQAKEKKKNIAITDKGRSFLTQIVRMKEFDIHVQLDDIGSNNEQSR